MWIALAILLGLLLAVVVLMAIPVDVFFRLDKTETLRVRVRVVWAFGVVAKELGKGGEGAEAPAKAAKTRGKRRPSAKKQGERRPRSAMAFFHSPGMAAKLVRLAKAVTGKIQIHPWRMHVTLGLSDPADTGQLYGLLAPAVLQAQRWRSVDLRLQPDFSQPIFAASGDGGVRVTPLAVIGVLLSFALSPTLWRAIVAANRAGRS